MTDLARVEAAPHLRVESVSKRFGGTRALQDVTVDLQRAHVHALVGENGAGKSTLGKIIAGLHVPDSGSIILDGKPTKLHGSHDAAVHGITLIPQELPLVPAMRVIDNVFLGIEEQHATVVSMAAMRTRLTALMEQTKLALDPNARIGTMRLADRQKVAILQAVARDAQLIVMDEPTASLSPTDAAMVMKVIRGLTAEGRTVVLVSHFLKDVLAVADEVTVLRNGQLVRTSHANQESEQTIVSAMLGRELDARFPDRATPAADAKPILEIRALSRKGIFEEVSLALSGGEVVGLAGLVGSGRTRLARTLAGVEPFDGGEMFMRGLAYSPTHPAKAIRAGVALIPDNRREAGLVMGLSVSENIVLSHLPQISTFGVVRRSAERQIAARAAARSSLPARASHQVGTLSGGNQQKVMFARWFVDPPAVLIADDPTRGIDIGAKRDVYDALVDLAAKGSALLVISNEVDELLGICNRIIVMRRGRLVAELAADDATEDSVMRAAFGGVASASRYVESR